MMKKRLVLMVLALFAVLVISGIDAANSETFFVSASVPKASGVVFTVTEIAADGTWPEEDAPHPSDLIFGTLEFDPDDGIFRPLRYFAIDLGVTDGGVGSPDSVQVSYVDAISNPNLVAGNGRGGLGKKATLQVTKAVLNNPDVPIGNPVILNNVASIGTLSKSNFAGGWPRLYVGIYDGNNDPDGNGIDNFDDTGWEVFTTQDAHGHYTGTLTVSAVVN